MLAKIICRGKRIVQAEPGIDRLRHLVRRQDLLSCMVSAGREAHCEQQNQPVPIKDLSAEQQQHDRTAERQHGRERDLMNKKIPQLTPPASPDQVVKCGPLIHLSIMTKKTRNRFFRNGANLVKVLELPSALVKVHVLVGNST